MLEETPLTTQTSEICFFAETNFRNQRRRFGIKKDDRRRHMYLIGKTGMGKTNMMEQMVLSDIHNGHGVGVVDPHGDFVEKIINYIPASRINDIIYFNPADDDFPMGFNVLESINPKHKHLVASGLMGVFKKIWPDVWSPRMEYILNNCILALLDSPNSTLLGINRLLVDKDFRRRVITQIQNPVVKTFWVNEYARYSEKFATEAIAPIQNKVGQFLSSSIIRNIIAQVKSTIDIRNIMDNEKIFIMNLSKGRIGEENMRLLGGMLITKLQLGAMERVDIPEEERKDFYLYVDEFQNFATESFANILSEARKYRLDLIMAHQYIQQLEEEVASAVFGNVGTLICFRIGAEDSEFLAKEFAPDFTEEDLVNLSKFDIYLKLMIDGVASSPFSAQTFLTTYKPTDNADKVIRVSRERYAEKREVIEDKILRWSGLKEKEEGDDDDYDGPIIDPAVAALTIGLDAGVSPSSENKFKKKKRETKKTDEKRYPAVCTRCGKNTDVPFLPDGSRPILCVDCYKEVMSSKDKKEILDQLGEVAKAKAEAAPVSLKETFAEKSQKPKKTTEKSINPDIQEISLTDAVKKFAPPTNKAIVSPAQKQNQKSIQPNQVISFD